MGEAWIIDAVRTPRGRGKKETGGLSGVHPQELMATCLKGLQGRSGFDPTDVEDVVAVLLTIIDKCPWGIDNLVAIKRVIIVAFPASMSAAVSDMLK